MASDAAGNPPYSVPRGSKFKGRITKVKNLIASLAGIGLIVAGLYVLRVDLKIFRWIADHREAVGRRIRYMLRR